MVVNPMSTNDYVKFVTQQVVTYMNNPKEDRVQKRLQRRLEKEPFLKRWFGVIPLSISLLYRRTSNRKKGA